MEPLIAVYSSTEHRNKGDKPVVVSGWTWIKNEKEAIDKCKKKISVDGNLISVHIAEWRKAPSEYKQLLGNPNPPMLDMAANLRQGHLRKSRREIRNEVRAKREQERSSKPTAPKIEEKPRFILITATAAT